MDGTATSAFIDGADLPDFDAVRRAPALGESGRALIHALLAHDADRVDGLLANDPALVRSHADGVSLAELAVATGDAGLLHLVLFRGAPPDGGGDGAPLLLALNATGPELALTLLAAGASPTPAAAPLDAFRAAIALGSTAGVGMLLDHGADPNTLGPLGRRPLHLALDMEQFVVAELLLDRGADPWAIDASGANLATGAGTPMISGSLVDAVAQARLRDRVRKLRWPEPPPAPRDLAARAAAGDWPPPRTAGS